MTKKAKSELRQSTIELLEKRIAEVQSRYPDRPIKFKIPRPRNLHEAIAVYGTLLIVSKERYWETDEAVSYLGELCYRHQYEGKWDMLQDILENCPNFPEYKDYILTKYYSEEDYYGNLEPQIYRMMGVITPMAHGAPPAPAKKSERHRGYRDKGQLRPDHEKGRNIGESKDDRVDRRNQINHPLLYEKIKPLRENMVPETLPPRKGDENYVYKQCS